MKPSLLSKWLTGKRSLFISLTGIVLLTNLSSAYAQQPRATATYSFSTAEQLQDKTWCRQIEEFYAEGKEGRFTGEAGVEIYYRIFLQPSEEQGAIMVSPGRTEAVLKYRELAFDLFNNGYSVYLVDHRGQGLSGRMTDDPEMGYVDDYQFYIDDMKTFYDRHMAMGGHARTFMLAHSLGGAIGMNYLEQHPGDFTAAAFSSPMLGLSAYICPLARILSGKTPKYAPGQTGYHEDSTSFTGNSVTGSEIRFHRMIAGYERVPEARLGGASLQWLKQSCRMMKSAFRNIDKLETPFILFAADNETVVNPKAYHKFMKKAGKKGGDGTIVRIENAQHELLMEKDPQRIETLSKTLDFFREQP